MCFLHFEHFLLISKIGQTFFRTIGYKTYLYVTESTPLAETVEYAQRLDSAMAFSPSPSLERGGGANRRQGLETAGRRSESAKSGKMDPHAVAGPRDEPEIMDAVNKVLVVDRARAVDKERQGDKVLVVKTVIEFLEVLMVLGIPDD